jgi:hypothetical protein
VNPDNNIQYISTPQCPCSQNPESAADSLSLSIRNSDGGAGPGGSKDWEQVRESSQKNKDITKIIPENRNQQFPDQVPITSLTEAGGKNRTTKGRTGQVSGVIPLPGILECGDFRKTDASPGICDICGQRAAVFQSTAKMTRCCAECYGRLVREGNLAQGAG